MAERIKRIKEEVLGVVSILGSIYLLMSLFTHYIKDPVLFFRTTEPPEPIRNLGGTVGAHISGWLIILLGLAAFIIPLLMIAFGIKRLLGKEKHRIYLLGGILFIVSSSLLLSLLSLTFNINIERYPDGIGGLIGRGIADIISRLLSIPGAYIFSLSLFLSSIILISPVSLTALALSRKGRSEERTLEGQEILVREPEPEPVSVSQSLSRPEAVKPKKIGGYELPPLELLNLYDSASIRPSKDELLTGSSLIEKKLEDFGVEGKVTQVHPGPIVTM